MTSRSQQFLFPKTLPKKTLRYTGKDISFRIIFIAKNRQCILYLASVLAAYVNGKRSELFVTRMLLVVNSSTIHRTARYTVRYDTPYGTIHRTARYTVLPYTPSYISRKCYGRRRSSERASERVNRKITIRHIAGRSVGRSSVR